MEMNVADRIFLICSILCALRSKCVLSAVNDMLVQELINWICGDFELRFYKENPTLCCGSFVARSSAAPYGWHWLFRLYSSFLPMEKYCISLWPSDAIGRQRTESTLAQVMACCLTAPSHYLNQCWLIISKVLWHSSEGIIMRRSEDTNQ